MGAVATADDVVVVPYRPRKWARPFHASLKRKAVLVLHRRAGKTVGVLNHHQRFALDDDLEAERLLSLEPAFTEAHIRELLRGRHYGHILPTYKQAKLVAWDKLKWYSSTIPGAVPNEVDLLIKYPNGSKLQLFGADQPDSLRGPAFSGLSFDEYSQHPPNIYSEVLSKALADHLGYAIFAGTIKGKNQLYKTYQAAKNDPEWFTLWQDVDQSIATEDDASIIAIRRAMDDDRDDVRKGLMTQAEFDQEWYLSPEAAIKGAIYGEYIARARRDGRIGKVPYDPMLPVDTAWDLGVGDATSIWFTQSDYSGAVRVIDFYEHSGEGLPHYAQVLRDKGYVYGEHYAPHDIQNTEFGSGRTRLETARGLGIVFQVVPAQKLEDGINAARVLFPKCWFDEQKCEHGLEALGNYRWGWNEQLGEERTKPVHDWSSHAADAFRYLALRQYTPSVQRRESERRRDDDPLDERYGKGRYRQSGQRKSRGGW
jgi:phage terminase large subunit